MQLISISAMWCPACLIMRPRIDKILKEFPMMEMIEYDYDMDEDVISKFEVGTTLPVFILMNNNQEVLRIIGEKKEEEIMTLLKGCIE